MTRLIYLTDSYQKELKTSIVTLKQKGDHWEVVLTETVFYPEGGGQPSDSGEIVGRNGKLEVTHVRMQNGEAIHEGRLIGKLETGEKVKAIIDWEIRFDHMRWHSAGHILHEAVMQIIHGLTPIRGEHGKHAYIEYKGIIAQNLKQKIEDETNVMVRQGRPLTIEFVSLDELKKRALWIPEKLPKNKPLRILQITGCPPIPDGGTQVKNTREVGEIKVTEIEEEGELVRVHYEIKPSVMLNSFQHPVLSNNNQILKQVQDDKLSLSNFSVLLRELKQTLLSSLKDAKPGELEPLRVKYFGTHGTATEAIKQLKNLPPEDRKEGGKIVNQFKSEIELAFSQQSSNKAIKQSYFDTSLPGIRPPVGHLHIVTQAIMEITRIFERIGFTRVRHPEIDWDYYPFESLNMPPNHPARDEWETFFIEYPGTDSPSLGKRESGGVSTKFAQENPTLPPLSQKGGVSGMKIVLTPHTSNGQVREMEKGKLPIRMINIAKCYRKQSDVSHSPMFHQFEGLYIDKNVSIGHLKGVVDYFFKQFYGPDRTSRIRPFHFQFTEPSFEIDVSCGICHGSGKIDNQTCKLCKEGWLELGGAGMVHPVVLRNGGIDPDKYNGFAFGWGVERTYMMKSGTQIDDVRLLYSNDIRFLEQF